jgi:beta-glucosidase/6-phospho-beta-glucosidase/beta-galactosidase
MIQQALKFSPSLFSSFILGGFECSTHRRHDGRRLDLVKSTKHDRLVVEDYRQLAQHGIYSVRDGLRWYLIENSPGRYDWTSFLPMLRAARDNGVQAIWDLCHYGWPSDIDIWKPEFVERFARFSQAAARVVRDETDAAPFFCPVNEISYFSWAGGDIGRFHPLGRGRGAELKNQLIRASIAAIEAVRDIEPRARFVQPDPLISVVTDPWGASPADRVEAENYRCAQYQSWDMLAGFEFPELGGKPEYLDIIGVNYYSDNQWMIGGQSVDLDVPVARPFRTIELGHPLYRPFRDLLVDIYGRYGRPILISETGAESLAQAVWLRYIADEVRSAIACGVPLQGICLYPIIHYPGWLDDRHCQCGLLGVADDQNHRAVDEGVAYSLRREQKFFANLFRREQRNESENRMMRNMQ